MKNGIGYTTISGPQYALVRGEDKVVDERRWPVTDEGEKAAIRAAKAVAKARRLAYIGEIR